MEHSDAFSIDLRLQIWLLNLWMSGEISVVDLEIASREMEVAYALLKEFWIENVWDLTTDFQKDIKFFLKTRPDEEQQGGFNDVE